MFIHGKPSNLHKIVFELRYRYGYTYLDRCGKTINAVMREFPEWLLKSEQVNPQGAALVSLANQCSFNFSSLKMDFGIEQPAATEISRQEVERFAEQIDQVAAIVVDQLGLREFTRIGLRAWYLFPSPSKQESEEWLAKLRLLNVTDSIPRSFEGELEAVGVSIVLAGADRKYRIGLNGVEKSAMLDLGSELMSVRASTLPRERDRFLKGAARRQYSPSEFGAMVDIDSYQEDPVSIEPRDFVETSLSRGLERFKSAVDQANR